MVTHTWKGAAPLSICHCFAWKHHFPDFSFAGFRSRTPGPPPFSSMNSTPRDPSRLIPGGLKELREIESPKCRHAFDQGQL